MKTRVVKWSSDLQTSNFKFEFVFIFQPFDIRIQASLIKRRRFCLETGEFQPYTVWQFLCSLLAINSARPAACLLTPPLPPCIPSRHLITLRLALRPWRVLYTDASYQWQILVAQTQSRHQSTAIEQDMAWRPGWLHCWQTASRHAACMLWPSSRVTTLRASSIICIYYSLDFGSLYVTCLLYTSPSPRD